ncbi:type VII secretion-associated protein [Mycobacterium sp.]|uniref:type VII secretion-associated protein n=1 Tax=Mycobacterium sp. TaxID=1785 RepID=UPI00126E75C9|nr:type VII secretion-associated protein [Mycobacterium sp.]KAA8966122.1 MAG: type VII secretion-associated protein [Mycobacterium sp.]
MTAPRTVIEAGPTTIRQLSCGETPLVDPEVATAALDGIDDPVALVDSRPVGVDELWCAALRSLGCRRCTRLMLIHPSWWSTTRVERVAAAAHAVADQVVLRPRSWLLARAAEAPHQVVVVEIADRLVVATGAAVAAEVRHGPPGAVADAVIRAIAATAPEPGAPVLIDVPLGLDGAGELAGMIAGRLRAGADRRVLVVDDARLRRLATAGADDEPPPPDSPGPRRRRARILRAFLPAFLLALPVAAAIGVRPVGRPGAPVPDPMPTTFLVEGRVAVEVPAQWLVQRVTAGPGSARVQVSSPSDPQVALHVTQSPVTDQTLAGAAESLKQAIDAEPAGVFVDFNPAGSSAGRPAVTYREVRAGHDIRWAVVVDRAVRIAIGCQAPPGGGDAVRDACARAVRSAHALG